MLLTGSILALTLAKGLARQAHEHEFPTGWTRILGGSTTVITRSAAHCPRHQCRAVILLGDYFDGPFAAAVLSPEGTLRCQLTVQITTPRAIGAEVCVRLSDVHCSSSWDASACSSDRFQR